MSLHCRPSSPPSHLHSALSSLCRSIGRYLLALLMIALILAAGHFLLEQGRTLRQSSAELASLNLAEDLASGARARLIDQVHQRAGQAAGESLAQIDQRILLQRGTLASDTLAVPVPADAVTARLFTHALLPVQKELARQELTYLLRLRAYLVAVSSRQVQQRALEMRRREHVAAYAQYQDLKNKKQALGTLSQAWMENRLPLDDDLSSLQRRLDHAASVSNSAAHAYQEQQAAIRQLGELAGPAVLRVDQDALDAANAQWTARLAQGRAAVDANWIARLGTPVLRQLPLAFAILLSGLLIHIAIKALFYYVLAPLATRCQPVRLLAAPKDGAPAPRATPSAVSQTVYLEPGQELLLLPDYLQSVSAAASKTTKWLFDWHAPWTSLIAGMVLLTRIRTDAADAIVVSSNADPLSEVALIAIPAGAALVFQPRALVGVIQHAAAPLRMQRRWQLLSMHAWLTMQLRYLIFTGPVTLVVKGSRGVRVESAGAGRRSRLISQAATLGFSAQLAYSTVRSATFIAYYTNRAALLDDRFEGDGVYVYAETARPATGGVAGRGMEGLVDAVLKVFGV